MSNHTPKLSFLLLWVGLMISAAFASTGIDPNTPIQIQSDSASFEQITRQANYVGNVKMTQGPHELHADQLNIKKDPKKHLFVITAKGKPATFTGKISATPHPVYATAKIIYYYPDKQLVVLEG